jgi:hypothetical protein
VADRTSSLYIEVVRAALRDWLECHSAARAYADRHPDQITFVRYEDLLARPHEEVKRVVGFLGATVNERIIGEMIAGSSFEALSGGRAPGIEDTASFYRKGVQGDWPNHLTAEALQIVEEGCAGAMEQMGYVQASATPRPARRSVAN